MFTAEEMVEAFNTAAPRKQWSARVVTTTGQSYVYFKDTSGLVSLNYSLKDGAFIVDFNKAVANFQDYCNAIARSLVSVLTALEAGGLPFKAPEGLEGIEMVVTHHGIGSKCTVRAGELPDPNAAEYSESLAIMDIVQRGMRPLPDSYPPTDELL